MTNISNMSNILKIKRFNPNTMTPHFNMFTIGKKSTGKSVLVKDIMAHHSNILNGCVILDSNSQWFYEQFVPNDAIKVGYHPEYIQELYTHQSMTKRQQSAYLIMEDCICCDDTANSKETYRVLMNGRSMGITCILTMQYPVTFNHQYALILIIYSFSDILCTRI